MRVGIGYDVHPLILGRKLMLGGVEIPSDKGLSGYSDADVIAHAIIVILAINFQRQIPGIRIFLALF